MLQVRPSTFDSPFVGMAKLRWQSSARKTALQVLYNNIPISTFFFFHTQTDRRAIKNNLNDRSNFWVSKLKSLGVVGPRAFPMLVWGCERLLNNQTVETRTGPSRGGGQIYCAINYPCLTGVLIQLTSNCAKSVFSSSRDGGVVCASGCCGASRGHQCHSGRSGHILCKIVQK